LSQATHTYEEWQQLGAGVDYCDRALIDGELVPAQCGETYECINPTTGQRLAVVAECGPEDVDRAVQAARKSFEDGRWSEAGPADWKAVMLRLAELIGENADELAVLETMDMGKTVEEAAQVDIPGAADPFQWYAETADKLLGEVARRGQTQIGSYVTQRIGRFAARRTPRRTPGVGR
jgi:gamma-glutamyl-gamma-aminobutyraldehyde dehydrogenase